MSTTTYLQNTHTGTGSSTGEKATMSLWVKRTDPSGDTRSTIIGARTDDNNYFKIRFADNDRLMVYGAKAGSTNVDIQTNAEFRDVFGWYHIVLQIDTTNATDTERVKWYVNGELQTIYSTGRVYPSQNDVNHLTSASDINIGCNAVGTNEHFDGSMSHFHMIDGTIYPPTAFGLTDSTTGEWKINTSPSVTYGAKGYFILKDGNSVTDQSGNSNNFTVASGTLTKTEDNPSNVFATINPLVPYSSNLDFHEGNTTVENDGSSANWTTRWGVSTLGMSSGKFYAEAKVANIGTNQMYALGLAKDVGTFTPTSSVGANGLAYYSTGNIYNGISGQDQTGLASYTTNDIIGLAIDATNGSAQWYKNGSAIGNAETIATDGTWFFVTNFYTNGRVNVNYGNGYFGTTAVSSAGTNASGNGIFEYDVPTGYTALSTKGLNL